jgi:UDP-N-acetylmuramate-alanine ligase
LTAPLQADEVIFLPIYAAREKNASGVTSRELSVKALEYSSNSSYVENFESAEKTLRSKITDTDMVVVMGAGDVTNLATSLVK